ncbi:MAG: hypothetical protein O7J95_03005 [Planctomycetota bacterium]|nr:hypothetical protein [Planctomycetota bacterium]
MRATTLPWYCFSVVLGATSIIVGVIWDISWHTTVGRDTFWTAAHMAIYLGGLLGGASCGWVAIRTTFRGEEAERAASVGFWGARAPLGAWVAIWGATAMLASAPFDDWWHNAYGLDVEILTPPHSVLATGMFGIALGAMLLVLGFQNRSRGEGRRAGGLLAAYAAGVLLTMAATYVTDYCYPNRQHGSTFYKVSSLTYPFYLVVAARAVRWRWPATTTALVYTGIMLVMGWILPLFPAEPLLAPIYNPLDHMAPPPFPLLLVAPAIAIDLALRALRPGSGWLKGTLLAALLGTLFLGIYLPVQWFFSEFLLSPAADNPFFFGAQFFAYFNEPGEWMHQFWGTSDRLTLPQLGLSWLLSVLSAGAGLAFGGWMSRVQR